MLISLRSAQGTTASGHAAAHVQRPALRAEWRTCEALAGIRREWQQLADRAIEPNVFYEPSFALAAWPEFGRGVEAALVWSDDHPARLLAFLPARVRHGLAPLLATAWTHPYAPLGTPLVDPSAPERTIDALLHHISERASVLRLPMFTNANVVAQTLDKVLDGRRMTHRVLGAHKRAAWVANATLLDGAAATLGKKRSKELKRQFRRLAEQGAVQWEHARTPDEVAPAVEHYLALEASGWKGRAGTAAGLRPGTRSFLQCAVTALAECGKAEVLTLVQGGRPVAAAILLRSGDTAWFWKIAYDEALARFSPGMQVAVELTERLGLRSDVARADSCATPDHPMIDHVWHERLPIADRLVATTRAGSAALPLIAALEHGQRGALRIAKAARDRLLARKG